MGRGRVEFSTLQSTFDEIRAALAMPTNAFDLAMGRHWQCRAMPNGYKRLFFQISTFSIINTYLNSIQITPISNYSYIFFKNFILHFYYYIFIVAMAEFQSQSGLYRGPNHGWTVQEDELLCECWTTISEDAVTGINQSAGSMWNRIHVLFKRDLPNNPADRTPDALQSRWKYMQKFLTKFNGLVMAIEREQPSGSTYESRV
jgi:hypothetical protein